MNKDEKILFWGNRSFHATKILKYVTLEALLLYEFLQIVAIYNQCLSMFMRVCYSALN